KVRRDEGLLRVEACGLCGSDVEQYRGHFVAKGLVTYPVIPSHEPIGIIEEIGSEAATAWGVKKGDRVALEPHLSCGRCWSCLDGRYHLCKSVRSVGWQSYGYLPRDFGHGLWGGYAEYIHLHPRTLVHKLPARLSVKLATMYQALAGGLRWSVQLPKTALGDCVLILGSGQRGLGCVVAAREAGAGCIIVTGLARDRFKLDLAAALGAHHTIVVDEEDTVARVMEITKGRGADVIVDVVPASPHPVVHAVEAARMGGTIVIAGVKGSDVRVNLDTDRVLYKELTIHGVFSQGWQSYEQALRILSENRYQLERLRTHDFALADVEKAILTLAGEIPGENAICVSVNPATG
ncbi:MAG: alcohol dehydrogenase catalytic domain-containing protein, partial [Rhodospirillaceae bacterium]|nr:alcohol dehydrogenase catalytic domain-containing protein [Rhodospirillaceae bacterium]